MALTPLPVLRNRLIAVLDALIAEHGLEYADARWPHPAGDGRVSEVPDPTCRTALTPDPTNQRRAEHIASTIRAAYGLLQDAANDTRHRADNTRRRNAVREGLCANCFQQPPYRQQRCTSCLKYLQRNGEERPRRLWDRKVSA